MINFHVLVVILVSLLAMFELFYTIGVQQQKDICPAIKFHMETHIKYLLLGIPLLIWLEIKLLTDADVLNPITWLLVWLAGVIYHLHQESSSAKKGNQILDLRSYKTTASNGVPKTPTKTKDI